MVTVQEQTSEWREKLGNNVKIWRISRGLSQQALANRTTATRATISKLELGNTQPKAEHLIEIATALQCDLRDIVPEIESPAYVMSRQEAANLLISRIEHMKSDLDDLKTMAERIAGSEPIRDPRLDSKRSPRTPPLHIIEQLTDQD